MTKIINSLSEISDHYEALFVDLWGCVHDGVRAYDAANKALIQYRSRGGKVILVTNSPKPCSEVEKQLSHLWEYTSTHQHQTVAHALTALHAKYTAMSH